MPDGVWMAVSSGGADVHYCWIPQDEPITTLCGVFASGFQCTDAQVNCPDCRDKMNDLLDAGEALETPLVVESEPVLT